MSHATQSKKTTAHQTLDEIRANHAWFEMSVADLRRQFARSSFRGHATFTKKAPRVPQGLGTWKWDTFGESHIPYVSLTLLDEPEFARYGVISQAEALAHMIVHVEAGTQCSHADPKYWDDAECEIELEAMQRMNWAPWHCDKWDPTLGDFVEYVPVAERASTPSDASAEADPKADETNAGEDSWKDFRYVDLMRDFMHSQFRGSAIFADHPAEVKGSGLGSWEWTKVGPNSQPYVRLVMLDQPTTKHHGMRTREAVLAHMLVHVEAGTQCTSAEPQAWSDVECEIELEAMRRMGWAPGCCNKWDAAANDFVEYVPVGRRASS